MSKLCKLKALISMAVFLLLCSCTKSRMNGALELAGDNRPELDKVLKHYSQSNDKRKLNAARFLIENMPGHYSYENDEVAGYYDEIDSVLSLNIHGELKKPYILDISNKYRGIKNRIKQDAEIITSEYLIYNIEKAFEAMEKYPWLEHLNFDEFCEYVLPYKCTELQSFDYWRDTLSTKFDRTLPMELTNDRRYNIVHFAAEALNREMRDALQPHFIDGAEYGSWIPFLNASTLYRTPFGNCSDFSIMVTCVLRSYGIPAMIDYVPAWGGDDGRHEWVTVLNNNGRYISSPFGLQSDIGGAFFPEKYFAKIMRRQYAPTERALGYLENVKYPHPSINAFGKDVTHEYIKTYSIQIPVDRSRVKDKYVYLGVWERDNWKIVDFGKIKGRKAQFDNIGPNVVYITLGYDGRSTYPISEPFIFDYSGDIRYLIPDGKTFQSVLLKRKIRKEDYEHKMEWRVVGGKIQAANNKDFSDSVTLYTIRDLDYPDQMPIRPPKPYRYWRFYMSGNSYTNLAELQFFHEGEDTPATGTIIGDTEPFENNQHWKSENAFDGDYLTVYHSQRDDVSWIGLDFGKPVIIDRARCVGRSDDNQVRYGDLYELKYWHNGAWRSFGTRIADDRFLRYDSVPKNTLLWLRNHTRGKQERIFTYENDRQVWW